MINLKMNTTVVTHTYRLKTIKTFLAEVKTYKQTCNQSTSRRIGVGVIVTSSLSRCSSLEEKEKEEGGGGRVERRGGGGGGGGR